MVRTQTILAAALLAVLLSSCSQIPKLLSSGGGTNVAANTQIGKENTQNLEGLLSYLNENLKLSIRHKEAVGIPSRTPTAFSIL